jgi:hypothetical protein
MIEYVETLPESTATAGVEVAEDEIFAELESGLGEGGGAPPPEPPGPPPIEPPIEPPGAPPAEPPAGPPGQPPPPGGGSIAEAKEIAQPIINQAKNLKCDVCAEQLAEQFDAAGYSGEYRNAQAINYLYMSSDFAPPGQPITLTGFHQGVVLNIDGELWAFDNFVNGMPLSEWEAGFYARYGITWSWVMW